MYTLLHSAALLCIAVLNGGRFTRLAGWASLAAQSNPDGGSGYLLQLSKSLADIHKLLQLSTISCSYPAAAISCSYPPSLAAIQISCSYPAGETRQQSNIYSWISIQKLHTGCSYVAQSHVQLSIQLHQKVACHRYSQHQKEA